jgi:hypothetical protein
VRGEHVGDVTPEGAGPDRDDVVVAHNDPGEAAEVDEQPAGHWDPDAVAAAADGHLHPLGGSPAKCRPDLLRGGRSHVDVGPHRRTGQSRGLGEPGIVRGQDDGLGRAEIVDGRHVTSGSGRRGTGGEPPTRLAAPRTC